MKGLMVAALLILCISFAEGLRCNWYFKIGRFRYMDTKKTCNQDENVCVTVSGVLPGFGRSTIQCRMCMTSSAAQGLKTVPSLRVDTCNTDLCN